MKFKLVENILFNEKDKYINFDKFENGEENILLVTGFSGSGKSTLTIELCKEYNATPIELDYLWDYLQIPECTLEGFEEDDGGDIFIEFINRYNLNKNKDYSDNEIHNLYLEYFRYLIDYCHKHRNQKFVINGIQIYAFMPKELYKGLPIIIVGTSAVNSTVRASKRNSEFSGTNRFSEFKSLLPITLSNNKELNQFKKDVKNESIEKDFKMNARVKDDSIEYKWYKNNDVVATVLIDKEPACDGYKWFGSLEVNSKYRNQGIGKQVVEFAKQKGAGALAVAKDNKIALNLYKSCGFKISSKRLDDEYYYMYYLDNKYDVDDYCKEYELD